ncbi:MAG TPA: hypothetical protein RMF84_01835 [Polyangiaceae bacterium LLY-WYZ-14_1]|jgi:tRNA (guanosine-2'-O-)-methyltransferase|nr:hypothetical protein [Polyangiaceae bacterium LLY-WYZ-14_1]
MAVHLEKSRRGRPGGTGVAWLVLTAALATPFASGCTVHTGVRAQARVGASAPPPPPPPSTTVRVEVQQPQVASNVTVVETTCGSTEACNGLDDNCNGVIDEGCGYSSGAIQVTLGWATGADLDLYVTDPMGETLSYQHTASGSGGRLDQDARGFCNRNQQANTTENVFWDVASPVPGQYRVEVHYWGECNSGAGTTIANLSIAVGGQVIGAYNVPVNPNQRVPVASFTVQ